MNGSPPMLIPPPPPLRSQRPLHRRRLLEIFIGVCMLGPALVAAAFYLEENWRGAHALALCQHELSAKGETLDWRAFIPPPIPDDQNLAMAPLFVRELVYGTDPKTNVYTFGPVYKRPTDLADMPFAGPRPSGNTLGGWELARHADLPFYQHFFREKAGFPHGETPQTPAEDVLLGLTRYALALDELAQAAAQRPLTRFPVYWHIDNPFLTVLPHYNLEQQFVRTLALRASARLAAGQPEDALRDLELCWRLSGDMGKDPVLIAFLVQITCVNISLSTVWEGLAARRWSAVELTRLQADLQRNDLLAGLAATFRGERAYGLRGIDYMEQHRNFREMFAIYASATSPPASNPLERMASALVPRGWFDLNQVTSARCMQRYCIDAVDPGAHRVFASRFNDEATAPELSSFTVGNALTRLSLPIFGSMGRRAAKLQTAVDEAATACALELFFLDHQTYPAGLDELVPAYLARVPTDVIDGAPLRYGPTPDGRYRLYGIGWNQRDDGGQVAWMEYPHPDDSKGDWVWQYTEPRPPAPAPKK